MTIADDFYIGDGTTELYDFFPLDFLLPNADEPNRPQWTFQLYSSFIKLGDGQLKGQGFPRASWSWNVIKNEHIEILRQYCPYPALSAPDIIIRTPTQKLLSGEIVWGTFSTTIIFGIDEERDTKYETLGFHIDFSEMVEIP